METQNQKNIRSMTGWQAAGAIIIVASIVVLSAMFVNAQDKTDKGNLVIQGSLKTTETDLNTKLAGTVKEVLVSEGDTVKAGDVILVMDSESIEAKKTQAKAAVEAANGQVSAAQAAQSAAQAQYDKALNGARSEEVAQAKTAYELAEKTYNRTKDLFEAGAIPESTYDEAKAQYDGFKEKYEMAAAGAREEDKAAAKAQVAQAASTVEAAKGQVLQAQGALDEVESYLVDSVIKAPSDGVITAINVNPGELVSTGMPLATISNADKPWVEVNVRETDLGKVELGGTVSVTFLAYPDQTYEGKIVKVNEKPDFATKRATNNNGEFDVLSYGVKVEISGVDQPLYPGMTAAVDFGPKDSASSDASAGGSDALARGSDSSVKETNE